MRKFFIFVRQIRNQVEILKIQDQKITLVDQVEKRLHEFFISQGYRPGDILPNEIELAESLGVARSVLREALSRFKMTGLIESRTRRGMVMSEPSLLGGMSRVVNPMWMTESTLIDILELRMALEIGITESIFRNITPEDISELSSIVEVGTALEGNRYAPVSEYDFHTKLYEISKNKSIMEFQAIIHPVMEFVKDKYKEFFAPIAKQMEENGETVSHAMLLDYIKAGDEDGYFRALRRHFKIYSEYLRQKKSIADREKKDFQ